MSSIPQPPEHRVNWPRRLLVAGIGLVIALVLVLIAAAFIPREWAQTVGGQADGGIVSGSALGLFYGFVFTLLPLLLLWFAYRFRWPPKGWLAAGIGAVLLAAPNLMTLSIVIGSGSGAHAGQRILDVDAPGFRGGTLVGVLLAVAVMAFWAVTMHMRRRTKRRNDDLEDELRRMEDRRAAEGRDAGR